MQRSARLSVASLLLLSVAFCLRGTAQPASGQQPCTNQSPRRLEKFDERSKTSVVSQGPDDTIFYTDGRAGVPQRLTRCGQHYHCGIENYQPACVGQVPTVRPVFECKPVRPGQWVEIHTVYAAKVSEKPCDPETLECCAEPPFVVMGYHAKVAASSFAAPVPVMWGPPSAEWLGSNTNADKPEECKPITAEWSFTMGCGFTVTEGQLRTYRHADTLRMLQPPARLGHPLVLVEKSAPH